MASPRPNSKGPQFVRYFAPLLKALHDLGGSGRPSEVESIIVFDLGIPVQEQNEVTKAGQSRFSNQVAWARFYLSKAGMLASSARGVWSLTPKGKATTLTYADALLLFKDVQQRVKKQNVDADDVENSAKQDMPQHDTTLELTPDEAREQGTVHYREGLLILLRQLPPAGFESLCRFLLLEAGFQKVDITGRSGDGGIDGHGVLEINPFVSFRVLFQCKRYAGSVGAPQVRDFRGAMSGRTDKGIILTTGTFTSDAKNEAIRDGAPPIELVDGSKLVEMFARLKIGLRPIETYEVDEAFFEQFRNV